ncbi:hypothetical protein EOD42_14815 [Rhodovarius crocodyli]|uniref:Exonuclease domain-containing protein n=1 Tax=Rhodovarius crocodyli TaxID=1979269 RepID=A0A437MFE1_9PROT|nr:hypothetical protein [Rhodovarius crocodyli]RVT96374.1 hypothetical protein EOD42_14815 [Rhodovarius crocodyli]
MSEAPVFLDIEASGITGGSFPIEIGWAQPVQAEGGWALALRSILIRPIQPWLDEPLRWDRAAEPVHGLTREVLLQEGLPPDEACDVLDGALAGLEVASDTGANGWDADWLYILYEAAGRSPRGWFLGEPKSGGLVARRLRAAGLDPMTVRPAMARWRPAHSHAAAEDAGAFAWEWAMAELLAAGGATGLTSENLPELIPAPIWPRPLAGGYRRREG